MGDAVRASGGWLLLAGSVCLAALGARAQTHPLNDTGQLTCYDYGAPVGTVSFSTADPQLATQRGQDCTLGRSAADALGRLDKRGGASVPGRDYSKIANDGSELPAAAQRGSAPGDWACTRDNVSGLVWELRSTDAGLRDAAWRYSWFDADGGRNGGAAGSGGDGNACGGSLPACNTTAYRDAVNALPAGERLCGASDWRIPSAQELQSLLVSGGAAGAIDAPWIGAEATVHWSGQTFVADAQRSWCADFATASLDASCTKSALNALILVRGGQ